MSLCIGTASIQKIVIYVKRNVCHKFRICAQWIFVNPERVVNMCISVNCKI